MGNIVSKVPLKDGTIRYLADKQAREDISDIQNRLAPIEEISQSFTVDNGKLCYVSNDSNENNGETINKPVSLDETLQDIADAMENIAENIDSVAEATIERKVNEDLSGIVDEKLPPVVANKLPGVVSQQLPSAVGNKVETWLDNNVDPSTGYVVDKTLSIEGAAADAKATGEIKSALTNNYTETITWESGGINSRYGADAESSTRIRTQGYLTNIGAWINPSSGYKIAIYVYDDDGTYQGIWQGSSIAKNIKWFDSVGIVSNNIGDYKFRFVFAKSDDATISTSDASNLSISSVTDNTLTKNQKAADAKKVGKIVNGFTADITSLRGGDVNNQSIKMEKLDGVTYIDNFVNTAETTNKTINSGGGFDDSNNSKLYDAVINVSNGDTLYRYNKSDYSFIGVYTASNNFIRRKVMNANDASYTIIDANAAYVRIADYNSIVGGQVWSDTEPTKSYPYGRNYIFDNNPLYADLLNLIENPNLKYPELKNKKILFMGDSILHGIGASNAKHQCVNLIAQYTGAICTNKSIGGSTICNGQYSTQEAVSILSLSSYDSSSEYYIDYTQYDILVILCGTNDWGYVIGTATELPSQSDPTYGKTVAGSLNVALKNIQTVNPSLRIVFFTPFYRSRRDNGDGMNSDDNSYNARQNVFNQEGCYYLYDEADMLENACKWNHVPCKNLYRTLQISKYNSTEYLSDGVHPNDKGHEMLANIICRFVIDSIGTV